MLISTPQIRIRCSKNIVHATSRSGKQSRMTAMGCADRTEDIRSVPDLLDFDEGRIE